MTSEEKQALANEAEKALAHPLVEGVVDEQLRNLRATKDSLTYYGLMKIAMYAATVARAQALGIDPDELRHTPEEAEASILARARRMVAVGKPVLRVDERGVTRLD